MPWTISMREVRYVAARVTEESSSCSYSLPRMGKKFMTIKLGRSNTSRLMEKHAAHLTDVPLDVMSVQLMLIVCAVFSNACSANFSQ